MFVCSFVCLLAGVNVFSCHIPNCLMKELISCPSSELTFLKWNLSLSCCLVCLVCLDTRREVADWGERGPEHHCCLLRGPWTLHLRRLQCRRWEQELHHHCACSPQQQRPRPVLRHRLPGGLHHHHDPQRGAAVHGQQPPQEDGESHQRVLPHRGRREAAEGVWGRQADSHHHVSQDAGVGQGHAVQDDGVRPSYGGSGTERSPAATHHELPHIRGGGDRNGRARQDIDAWYQTSYRPVLTWQIWRGGGGGRGVSGTAVKWKTREQWKRHQHKSFSPHS